MGYEPIENYGVIGDLNTVALVGMNGSIDFMCFPDFDSPSIFAALLDDKKGGRFLVAPTMENPRLKQFYLPDTNILLTRFFCEGSIAEVSDFMTVDERGSTNILIRRAKAVRGQVKIRIVCEPRFDYGRQGHRTEQRDGQVFFIPQGEHLPTLRLRTRARLHIADEAAVGEYTLSAGESLVFLLEVAKHDETPPSINPDYSVGAFKETMNFWRNWVGRSNYRGRWREMVNRSALTLKMLTSKTHGSLVAAPTFGLPEQVGGERNWDYRFTWIRDASFTLDALISLGYTEEAAAFMNWIEDRCNELNPDGSLQIMYGLNGEHDLTEEILPHFEGYRGSSPVRIGNGAYGQLQLDIYGELMSAVYLYNKFGDPISIDLWLNLTRLLDWVSQNWKRKDEGIWEVRGGRQEFLYSRLMCWVALDRGISLALERSFPAEIMKWRKARDEIYRDILDNFWDPKQKFFVQTKRGTSLDASSLLMPFMKFLGPRDPRWISTLQGIKNNLADDSLVHRYNVSDSASDGLSGGEGTFNMCTFWYVENLSRSGDIQQARYIFEKMLCYANHLGLYSEELGPSGEHLGNFPQAFTHLGLISAARNLDKKLG
ncbi:MAG: glycoside hydrolase family 15 protein [Waddliaceae bacterium]